ncbi:MAG: tetratricopeptide repeat protein [Phycisphaerae bacterium]
MNRQQRNRRIGPCAFGMSGLLLLALLVPMTLTGGCTRDMEYHRLRRQGRQAMMDGMYAAARYFLEEGDRVRPRQVETLYDLGVCNVMLARQNLERGNRAAAMRDADAAIAYYSQAIEVHPGHRASLKGKNVALELKGQFDDALRHAEWAAKIVGPSAKQYIFLGGEHEERGDLDAALLAYRQAVATQPDSAAAHTALAKFLLRHQQEPEAIHHLQAAYRLNPLDQWVIDQLAAHSAVPPLATAERSEP